MSFAFWLLVGIVGMEVISYFLHKYIFHGLLWNVHKTHHLHKSGKWELNDIFSIFFSLVSVGLIFSGTIYGFLSVLPAIGFGMTLYGAAYFLFHDFFIHRRIFKVEFKSPFLRSLKEAHLRHHQSVEKKGREPFGLFWFFDK